MPGPWTLGQGLKGLWEELQHRLYRNDNGSVMRWTGFNFLSFVYYCYYYCLGWFCFIWIFTDLIHTSRKSFHFWQAHHTSVLKKVLDKYWCMKEYLLKPVGSSRQSTSRTVNQWFILRVSVPLFWAGTSQDLWPTEYILKAQRSHRSKKLQSAFSPSLSGTTRSC